MNYFCYISKAKVDQLLATLDAPEVTDISQEEKTTLDKKHGAAVNKLFGVIDADLTFGRSDSIQRQFKLKQTYVQKLKTVLKGFANDVRDFDWALNTTPRTTQLFLCRGVFAVIHLDEAKSVATIATSKGHSRLNLYCSLSNFSTGSDQEKFQINSSNYGFFEKRQEVTFETAFLLTSVNGADFFGSPLYLQLAAVPGLLL